MLEAFIMILIAVGFSYLGYLVGITTRRLEAIRGVKAASAVIKKEMMAAYEQGMQYGAVKPQIDRINEISQEQIGYFGAMDQPNKNASHSRYKNDIVKTLRTLEQEKKDIFKSILASGNDPTLVVLIDGEKKSLKVSELAAYMESGSLEDSVNEPEIKKTETNHSGSRSKLRVINFAKENDDVKPNPSDAEVH